jgi:hypothetical protein
MACQVIGFGGATHAGKKWLFRDTRQIVSIGLTRRKLAKNRKGQKDTFSNASQA